MGKSHPPHDSSTVGLLGTVWPRVQIQDKFLLLFVHFLDVMNLENRQGLLSHQQSSQTEIRSPTISCQSGPTTCGQPSILGSDMRSSSDLAWIHSIDCTVAVLLCGISMERVRWMLARQIVKTKVKDKSDELLVILRRHVTVKKQKLIFVSLCGNSHQLNFSKKAFQHDSQLSCFQGGFRQNTAYERRQRK